MNLKNFFDKHNKKEREKKLIKACLKLIKAVNEGNGEYIVKRIAYLEFILEQFKQKYNWEEHVYKHKHQLENILLYERDKDE